MGLLREKVEKEKNKGEPRIPEAPTCTRQAEEASVNSAKKQQSRLAR